MPDHSDRALAAALAQGVVDRAGDAEHVVERPGASIDGDDEEVAGDPRTTRLGRHRREHEAARRIAVREPREVDAHPVRRDREDLSILTIGHDQMAAGTHADGLGHRPAHDEARLAFPADVPDLTRTWLPGSSRSANRPDPEPAGRVDRQHAWPRDGGEARIDDSARGVEPQDQAAVAVGNEEAS